MSDTPVLVVMAAGMGSRYGGLKQIDPLGPNGQIILDYSIFDAYRAGFRHVIFIIKPELEESFEKAIGAKARRLMQVNYVYQTLNALPDGLSAPNGRVKPLGTGHAVWCLAGKLHAPFAVINADDFYGADAFKQIYSFLSQPHESSSLRCCMVGYRVENTLTENGTVSRGVCAANAQGDLVSIIERTAIHRDEDGVIRYDADGDAPAGTIAPGTPVSMNLWGFSPRFLDELTVLLRGFFSDELRHNPEKAEFYLPFAVDSLIRAGKTSARLLTTDSRWFGVTYQADKPTVMAALAAMTDAGEYPADL